MVYISKPLDTAELRELHGPNWCYKTLHERGDGDIWEYLASSVYEITETGPQRAVLNDPFLSKYFDNLSSQRYTTTASAKELAALCVKNAQKRGDLYHTVLEEGVKGHCSSPAIYRLYTEIKDGLRIKGAKEEKTIENIEEENVRATTNIGEKDMAEHKTLVEKTKQTLSDVSTAGVIESVVGVLLVEFIKNGGPQKIARVIKKIAEDET